MKIVLFGGTTEGRELSQALAALGAEVVVSVASEYGAEEQGTADGITVEEGLKDEAAIGELIRGADLVIDATHPYAVLVTANIREAAEKEGIERLRLIRESSAASSDAKIRIADDPHDAARLAAEAGGNVLLTTGSKDLPIYAEAIEPSKLYPRVLPLISSIQACEAAEIPHRNIIAVQGPFSEELNRAVIRDYGIDLLITKESGRAGGFEEKLRACEACGIPAIVIRRPEETGYSYEEVLQICKERIK